ncbi:MAG: patatin-like phospholipase family protein [Spirochaetia bacterium]|nr:patatin-like phospholipase family protein [Spirochaetia bacterium]
MGTGKKALILSGGGARGAYQVGVWKYLAECGWKPDLICGTSAGALNAAAIGCSVGIETMEMIWKEIERKQVYRFHSFTDFFLRFRKKDNRPLLNPLPLEEYISRTLDLNLLKKSTYEIYITAVSILDSTLHIFKNKEITIDHIMASSSIPVLFPWREIKNRPYWDGGVMMNTPILPALKAGASEIIVVLPSPIGGREQELPRGTQDILERVFEQALAASFLTALTCMDLKIVSKGRRKKSPNIYVVSPERMMGFQSLLDFSSNKTTALVKEGYRDAEGSLGKFFKKIKKV